MIRNYSKFVVRLSDSGDKQYLEKVGGEAERINIDYMC